MHKVANFLTCLAAAVSLGIIIRYAAVIVGFGLGIVGNPFRPQIIPSTLLLGIINGVIAYVTARLNGYRPKATTLWAGAVALALLAVGEVIGLISRSGQLWNTAALVIETDVVEIAAVALTGYCCAVSLSALEAASQRQFNDENVSTSPLQGKQPKRYDVS